MGKSVVSLVNRGDKSINILIIEGLTDNLLSISQTCDQGYDVIFQCKCWEVKSIEMGEFFDELLEQTTTVMF